MYSARTVRLFGLACLLVLLPWVALGQKPPEGVDKPKEKPGDGAKDDKPKGEEKPGKDDKPKAEEKGGPPTLERYVEILKSGNVLVRKRAAMVLMQKGPDAFPALLELSVREQDKELRKFLAEKMAELYSTKEQVGALVKTLKDSSSDLARRQVACSLLPQMLAVNPRAEPFRADVKAALEFALADANDDLQVAAARALEDVDHPEGLKERLLKPRATVRLALDPSALKALRLKADEVVQAIQKEYPEFKARLADESTIEVLVSDTQRVVLTERLQLPGSGGIRLKDILSKDRPAPATGQK